MRWFSVLLVGLVAACPVPPVPADGPSREGEGEEGEGEEGEEGEGENPESCSFDDDTGFDAPLSNRTDAVGSSRTLDVATWDLSHFGNAEFHEPRQVALAADIITSLNLDIIGVQEIENERAFDELRARLPGHDGVLGAAPDTEGGFEQRVGLLYRCGELAVTGTTELFQGNFNFPRAPLQVEMRYDDGDVAFDFYVLVVHFKAFTDTESHLRRQEAFILLQNYVDSVVDSDSAPDNVMIIGDFNERLDDARGEENWAPFLDASKYVVRTQPLADRGEASFISGSAAILDHIVTTRALDDEIGAGIIQIPRVDNDVPDYRDEVSDHRPVVLVFKGLE